MTRAVESISPSSAQLFSVLYMLRLAPRLLSSVSLSFAPLVTASRVRMASTAELSPSKIFSLEGKTALVTGAGTGIGLVRAISTIAQS